MQSDQGDTKQRINNVGFKDISNSFLEKGWIIRTNTPTRLEFQSPISAYDVFEFEVVNDKIYVTIPLKTSRYKYTTRFSDYYSASSFAEMHLSNF
jgi:hypothetical protein